VVLADGREMGSISCANNYLGLDNHRGDRGTHTPLASLRAIRASLPVAFIYFAERKLVTATRERLSAYFVHGRPSFIRLVFDATAPVRTLLDRMTPVTRFLNHASIIMVPPLQGSPAAVR